MRIALSVLDQTPIRPGATPAQAVAETLELSRLADRLGYRRYWLSEHHSSNALAGTAPEILIGPVASATRRIRVGSGGVMLSHYAPLKVAESFRLLEVLHPGRIDLGIGRAAGATTRTTTALQGPGALPLEAFPEQLRLLKAFLTDRLDEGHPLRGIQAMPRSAGTPELWLLGSGGESAQVAAELGAGFSYAHFINPDGQGVVASYRRAFKPSAELSAPRASLAVSAVCADTEAEARELALPTIAWGMRLVTGKGGGLPSPEEVAAFMPTLTAEERAMVEARLAQGAVGAPAQARDKLLALARSYEVDELVIVTICHDFEARKRSYELLAEAFGLEAEPVAAALSAARSPRDEPPLPPAGLPLPAPLWSAVRAAHAEPGRAYHDLSHVRELLARLGEVARDVGWAHPREVFLAALFHDAVYVPGQKDNEARSAEAARQAAQRWLSEQALDLELVTRLILLTARHGSLRAGDVSQEEALFLDCDMAVLGSDAATFDAYDRAIAEEYRAVPPELYAFGRRHFFQGLLASESIFLSPYFRARLEAPARENLRRALAAYFGIGSAVALG